MNSLINLTIDVNYQDIEDQCQHMFFRDISHKPNVHCQDVSCDNCIFNKITDAITAKEGLDEFIAKVENPLSK